MKKTGYWAAIVILPVTILGCSSSELESYQLFPDDFVYDVPYDSIYHYGYNQGCDSALGVTGSYGKVFGKDETLDGSDTKFNQGWDDGNQACKSGMRVLMPTSFIQVN
ncbi:hypothetical protein RJ45_11790 [Photobacterium gaetbulicola]|uniref:Lipoprotein n=1 Tax=Photobacterium gaetbulicola TaxID=1295392 RepID=A0A0B9GXK1_9GAMM|nr:hypothetical protein [Photobacterium gaetbulicola]KHT63486.1 hypothetical protein RJ45_11790 [Photobacterium gaetbulicola]